MRTTDGPTCEAICANVFDSDSAWLICAGLGGGNCGFAEATLPVLACAPGAISMALATAIAAIVSVTVVDRTLALVIAALLHGAAATTVRLCAGVARSGDTRSHAADVSE
jgi:hypothetical protein